MRFTKRSVWPQAHMKSTLRRSGDLRKLMAGRVKPCLADLDPAPRTLGDLDRAVAYREPGHIGRIAGARVIFT